jgi:hypothetical protein
VLFAFLAHERTLNDLGAFWDTTHARKIAEKNKLGLILDYPDSM